MLMMEKANILNEIELEAPEKKLAVVFLPIIRKFCLNACC